MDDIYCIGQLAISDSRLSWRCDCPMLILLLKIYCLKYYSPPETLRERKKGAVLQDNLCD
jgi:hypothetical protein